MHFAKLKNSPRLKRVLNVLNDGEPHTTREIIFRANVCAVNAIVAELRENGIRIRCWAAGKPYNKGVYFYQKVEQWPGKSRENH